MTLSLLSNQSPATGVTFMAPTATPEKVLGGTLELVARAPPGPAPPGWRRWTAGWTG